MYDKLPTIFAQISNSVFFIEIKTFFDSHTKIEFDKLFPILCPLLHTPEQRNKDHCGKDGCGV